jgi:tRNA/tmRNA/rRNA uracil-C5-methylase (TrmA/RlmC/RlmD family)
MDVHAMEEPWRYRHTAAIAIGWEAGFRPRGRRGILEIHDCLIAHPLIGALAAALNNLLRTGSLPNYHGKVWLDCTVIGSPSAPALQVLLQGIEGLTIETHPELPEVAGAVAALPGVQSVAYRHRSGEPRPLVGDLFGVIEVAGRPMVLPAGSFFQTNLALLPRVLSRMRSVLQERSVQRAADIYGGVGTLGLPLASLVDTMTIVELDPLAMQAAQQTASLWGLANVSCVSRHAERALPDLPALDLAIVDPPRSGLGEVVIDAVIGKEIPLLFYLSCAPPSLARDLAALESQGYRMRSLEIFDFYPQTYHVETLAILER